MRREQSRARVVIVVIVVIIIYGCMREESRVEQERKGVERDKAPAARRGVEFRSVRPSTHPLLPPLHSLAGQMRAAFRVRAADVPLHPALQPQAVQGPVIEATVVQAAF